jgi:hypothetical protein
MIVSVLAILAAACTSRLTPTPIPTVVPTSTASPTPLPPTATDTPLPPTKTPTPSPLPTATENPFGIDWAVDCENESELDGYWFHTNCIPGVVTKDFWLSPSPSHYVGGASAYSEGIMEQVAVNRGLSLNGVWGGVATMFCGDIGRTVYLRPFPQGRWQGPYLVVDCSAREHLYFNVILNKFAVEVDWQTWQRWRADGNLSGVHVCFGHPDCGVANSLSTYFERNVVWERPD